MCQAGEINLDKSEISIIKTTLFNYNVIELAIDNKQKLHLIIDIK